MKYALWTSLSVFLAAVAVFFAIVMIMVYRSVEYQLFFRDASWRVSTDFIDTSRYIIGWMPLALFIIFVSGILSFFLAWKNNESQSRSRVQAS